MKSCPECYSDEIRVTPLCRPYECLIDHTQYICGTCSRCICIEKNESRDLYRWKFPFKSLRDAKLYIRVAEYVLKHSCEIYEIKLNRDRSIFKIFQNKNEVHMYIKQHKPIKFIKKPVFKTSMYQDFPKTEVRKLTKEEVAFYIIERDKLMCV